MQIRFNSAITVLKRFNDWSFALTPAIKIRRSDMFASEASYYFIVHWLVFQVYMQITTKKIQK